MWKPTLKTLTTVQKQQRIQFYVVYIKYETWVFDIQYAYSTLHSYPYEGVFQAICMQIFFYRANV